jgi:hypothetical protein
MRKILDFKDFSLFEAEVSESKSSIFDLENNLAYQTIKDLRTATINGKEYTFICVGSGMSAYAESVSKTDKKIGDIISKMASKKDQTLVFSPDGIYVMSEAAGNGVMTLASSIFSYVKEGSITAGISVIYTFKKINIYYKNKGEEPFNNIKENSAEIFNVIMKDLYKLAEESPKASEAVSVLVVGAYKSSTSSFKTIPNFLNDCIYKTAKDTGIRSVNIGQGIEDFYKVAQNTLDNLNIPINKTIEEGIEKLSSAIEKGVRKTEIFSARLRKEAGESLRKLQNRIAPTAKIILSKSKPVWDSISGKKKRMN